MSSTIWLNIPGSKVSSLSTKLRYFPDAIRKPAFLADFAVRYTHRKFAIGATAEAMGSRSWTFIDTTAANGGGISSHKYPACVDLGLTFDWFVAKQCTVYVEGRNLANAKIYDWALYSRLGAGAVVGIKVQF